MKYLIRGSVVIAFGVGLLGCQRGRIDSDSTTAQPVDTTVHAARAAPATEPAPSAELANSAPDVSLAGVGSCRTDADVSATASRLADLADANGDGKVSRDEAHSAMNFIVGGAFFRADANGDGRITPEEGRQARGELTKRYPALGTILTQSKQVTGESPFRALARVLDVDYGKSLSLEDARQAVGGATDDLFKVADRNHDGMITRDEAINTGWDQARSLGAQAFASADGNKDGYISPEEFQNVISRSSRPLFDAADGNNDGKLSEREAAMAMNTVVQRFGMTSAAGPGPQRNAPQK